MVALPVIPVFRRPKQQVAVGGPSALHREFEEDMGDIVRSCLKNSEELDCPCVENTGQLWPLSGFPSIFFLKLAHISDLGPRQMDMWVMVLLMELFLRQFTCPRLYFRWPLLEVFCCTNDCWKQSMSFPSGDIGILIGRVCRVTAPFLSVNW